MKPPVRGFDAPKYKKDSIRAGKKYQKKNVEKSPKPGISSVDQRSSMSLLDQVSIKYKPKPMAATYGTTVGGKGATKRVRRAK